MNAGTRIYLTNLLVMCTLFLIFSVINIFAKSLFISLIDIFYMPFNYSPGYIKWSGNNELKSMYV